MGVEGDHGTTGRYHSDQQLTGEAREQETQRATEYREQRAFGQQLPHHTKPACSDREPDRYFVLMCGGQVQETLRSCVTPETDIRAGETFALSLPGALALRLAKKIKKTVAKI